MARLELLWSPVHKDYFILWGTEICLYKFEEKNALKSQRELDLFSIFLEISNIA